RQTADAHDVLEAESRRGDAKRVPHGELRTLRTTERGERAERAMARGERGQLPRLARLARAGPCRNRTRAVWLEAHENRVPERALRARLGLGHHGCVAFGTRKARHFGRAPNALPPAAGEGGQDIPTACRGKLTHHGGEPGARAIHVAQSALLERLPAVAGLARGHDHPEPLGRTG